MFLIFMSVVKHDGRALSFRDSGDTMYGLHIAGGGHVEEQKTWHNHSQDKPLACRHKACWSLSKHQIRSRGFRKSDTPMRRSCESWSTCSRSRHPSCGRNISRRFLRFTPPRSQNDGIAPADG